MDRKKALLWGGVAAIGIVGYMLYKRNQSSAQSTTSSPQGATPAYIVGNNGYLPGHSLYVNQGATSSSQGSSGGGTVGQTWYGGSPQGTATGVSANG